MDTPKIVIHSPDPGCSKSSSKDPEVQEKNPFLPQSQGMDKYTADIELSNACREFYVSRLERMRGRSAGASNGGIDRPVVSSGIPTLDAAMNTLRKEMASLMEQDLALMKQLLTLNEQIEELKWRGKITSYLHPGRDGASDMASVTSSGLLTPQRGLRGGGYSTCSSAASSTSCLGLLQKYPSPSELSLLQSDTGSRFSTQESLVMAIPEEPSSPQSECSSFRSQTSTVRERELVEIERNGSCSTRSTSDLGSSGDEANSMTDLYNSHHNALSESNLKHHNAVVSDAGSDHDGYFSLDKNERDLSLKNGKLSQSKDLIIVEKDSPGDQRSFDSGIQDSENNELLISRL